jgi:phosphatidate phosphatase PAH1
LPGTSDIIIVKHKIGTFKSTPFLACFGPYAVLSKSKSVKIYINDVLITDLHFSLDDHGYSYPMYPSDKDIRKMGLKFGKNKITY